jgi:membrane protein
MTVESQESPQAGEREKAGQGGLHGFWRKLNEDWIANFSGMLAFNYLTATAPLLLVGLTIGGLALSSVAPDRLNDYIQAIAAQLPGGGEEQITAVVHELAASAGALLIIAILAAIFAGSRLFIALENCFSVIYRLSNRPALPQNLLAIVMTLVYALLAPLAYIASGQLSTLFTFFALSDSVSQSVYTYLVGLAAGVFIAFVLFYVMYAFVPNRPFSWSRTLRISWRGALIAAILLTAFEQLFPLYQMIVAHGAAYASVAGLAVVIILFLYVIGYFTLLGAEINAWAEGLRPLGAMLPDLYRDRSKASGR